MPATMTRRERVERAMACEETDRVPTYDLLRNDAAFAHYAGEPLPPLSDDDETVAELNRIAGKAVNACLDMTRSFGFGPVVERDFTDQFGIQWHTSPWEKTTWIAKRPFDDEAGGIAFLKQWIQEVRRGKEMIEAEAEAHRRRHHERFMKNQALMGDTVQLLTQHGVGLDDIRYRLGLELFSYISVDEPGLISEACEVMTEKNIAECRIIADTELSPVVLTYSDIACKERLLHSPDWLRAEFFPRLKRLNDAWHEQGFKCLFHSDGYVMPVIGDLLEAGIDGLNPIETVAGMDLAETRARCGEKIFLAGGIDMSQLLANGTPEEVRAVCEAAIRDAAPGYFMGSTTEADNSCRLENLIVMYETAMGSGGT